MKYLKKYLKKYLGIVFVFLGCQNSHTDLIIKIDSIKEIQTLYEIEIDSAGKETDTISILKIKQNKDKDTVYKEYKLFNNDDFIKSIQYYNNHNMFFSKTESSKYGIISTYEAWREKGKLKNAISVEYYENKPSDTVFIEYEYLYKDNIKQKTIVTAKLNGKRNLTEIIYNNFEKPISEILTYNKDTLKIIDYTYAENSLSKKEIWDIQNLTFISLKYDFEGFLQKEEVYWMKRDSLIKLNEKAYKTNKIGEITTYKKIDYPSMSITNVIFKKE